jgi:hypothetical protein
MVKGKRKDKIADDLKIKVWMKRNGDFVNGKCYVCNNEFNIKNFECGHIEAEAKGGVTTIDNLEPICSNCNKKMGTMNLLRYIEINYSNRKHEESFYEKYNNKCPICNELICNPSINTYEKINNNFYICKYCNNDYNLNLNLNLNLSDYSEFKVDSDYASIKNLIEQIKRNKNKNINIKNIKLSDISLCHLLFTTLTLLDDDDIENENILFMLNCFVLLFEYRHLDVIQILLEDFQFKFNCIEYMIKSKTQKIFINLIIFMLGNRLCKIKVLTDFYRGKLFVDSRHLYNFMIKCVAYYFNIGENKANYDKCVLLDFLGDLNLFKNINDPIEYNNCREIYNYLEIIMCKIKSPDKYNFDEIMNFVIK